MNWNAEYATTAASPIPEKIQRVTTRETPGVRNTSPIPCPRSAANRTIARGTERAKRAAAVIPRIPSKLRFRGSVRTGRGTVSMPYNRRAPASLDPATRTAARPAGGVYVTA